MFDRLQIKQYQNTILTNILSSQFVYSYINQKCELKKQILTIENKKKKNIYYLYLFLTTNKRPYVKKQSLVSKNLNKTTTKPKTRTVTWKVEIKKQDFSTILSQILFKIIPFQTNSEKKILKVNGRDLDLNIQYAPLTIRTAGLAPQNSYFSDIRLIWKLRWTQQASIFQKIFIIKHLKILNEAVTLKCLENAN